MTLLSFSVFPFLVPFSFVFVLSSCRFPFVSCIAFFASLFASLLSFVADSVVLLFRLGATPPARSLPEVCVYTYSPWVLSSVFFLALLLMLIFFVLLFLPFFRFRFGHRLFHPVLLLSPFRFLLRLVLHMICIVIRIIRTLISPFHFLSELYTISLSYCVLRSIYNIIFCF